MEGVKAKVRRQIIMNFYQKNMGKRKLYTIKYFAKLDVGKMQVYQAIARVESGESHLHGAGAGRPRKLSKTQEKQVVKAMENKSGSSLRETLLKRCKDASKESRRQYRATTT